MERRSKVHKIDCISVSISSIFYKIEHKFDGDSYAAKEVRKEFLMKKGYLIGGLTWSWIVGFSLG
jgi:hypothetical protein